MKKNLPVTNNEQHYGENETITSSTDLKGSITYINEDFTKVSGFSETDLLNKNHNIVRHPDMPPAAFADLWKTLKSGNPWMGIVKNRCKNGDYYWVDAFVTPRFENGTVTGYESTRVQPDRTLISRAEQLYQRIWAGKTLKPMVFDFLLSTRLILGMAVLQAMVFVSLYFLDLLHLLASISAFACSMILTFVNVKVLLIPLSKTAQEAREIVANPVMQQVYTGRTDEVGQFQLTIKLLRAKLRTVTRRLEQATSQFSTKAEITANTVSKTQQAMTEQQQETEQVVTAMHEMTATIQEVARSAVKAAEAANEADQLSKDTAGRVEKTMTLIDSLSGEVNTAEAAIQKLAEDSNNIGSVLDVIKNIAEQTNLLALNAAIEAARAGEQGRGFAVVADEVRTLASRTQQSTQEINVMIDNLQIGVNAAVDEISKLRGKTAEGVEHAKNSSELLSEANNAVATISDMNHHIASATEQQNSVAEEISRNIENINQLSHDTAENARISSDASQDLAALSKELQNMVQQFDDK